MIALHIRTNTVDSSEQFCACSLCWIVAAKPVAMLCQPDDDISVRNQVSTKISARIAMVFDNKHEKSGIKFEYSRRNFIFNKTAGSERIAYVFCRVQQLGKNLL